MAVDSNGKIAEPGKKGMNGHAKAPKPKPAAKKQKSFSIFSTITRLLTWFSIITILFRCPSTIDQITDSSPYLCRPYFQVRSILTPHLEPYYTQYAAPYVDAARPYYDVVDQRVITPATVLGMKYGAPRAQQAQAYGKAQWEKNVQPQVTKYQGIAKAKYDETLGPHINKAYEAGSPYYEIARNSALQTYYEHILPTYTMAQPYALQGYGIASEFAIGTALPFTKWAWTTAVVFLDRTVWPKVRILYGENVEPQLVRIGERLGRYRDGQKLKAVVDEVDSSYSSAAVSETSSFISSSIASPQAFTQTSSAINTVVASTESPEATPASEVEVREKAQKVVQHDLKTWQEKFAKAADEGSDDLDERITEITERLIKNQAQSVGGALIIELEETVKSSLKNLKSSIISIVNDAKEFETSEDELTTAVRKAGIAIKDKAQAIRTWRQNFDGETNSLVSKSAQDTFEILDHIRDLGLQEMGMRWAWTDGITHKDWSKYHQLKTKFDEWRYDVEKVATEHAGLTKARAASEEVESQAMGIAEDAARELARLKETGRWKISAGDTSDDFSTKIMPAAAVVAGQKVLEKITEISGAVAPSSQGTAESFVSVISSSLADGVSTASSVVSSQVANAQSVASSLAPSSQGTVESVISEASVSASSIGEKVSASVIGTSQGTIESVASVASESANSIIGEASNSIVGTPQGTVESIISVATESVSSLSAAASSSIIGEEPGFVEKASSSIQSAASIVSDSASSLSNVVSSAVTSGSNSYSSLTSSLSESLSKSAAETSSSLSSAASSASSTASKKVFGGAMAQFVEARQIVFEDIMEDDEDQTFSNKVQNLASEAGDRYADVTKAISEALFKPEETGTGESVSIILSSRYADAIVAASSIIYGTPMPITESIASQATAAYSAALSQANDYYSHARSMVSAQISGEPKPVHEEMFSSVEKAYSDSVSAASARLQGAYSAGSSVVYGTPTPAYQSVIESYSSIAQARLNEGLSAASSHFSDAKAYAASLQTGAPEKKQLLSQIQDQYYAGIGMAHARYSEFLEAASSAVMPTATPFLSQASASVFGTPTGKFEEALSTASSYYSDAVASASSQLDQALASISAIGAGNKDIMPTASLAIIASSRYNAAISQASSAYLDTHSVIQSKLQSVASEASSVVIGSETPWTESVASAASENLESASSAASQNWEALITKASEQIYGAPTPYFVTRSLLSVANEYAAQVTNYAAQATDGAVSQYSVMQSLISELIVGKEPDFTESVYNRFSSAYYTGAGQIASSASSYASEAYASASSVMSSVFTPPATLEAILDSAASQVNAAVDAASTQFYGSKIGAYEQASSSAASAYSSISNAASIQAYGSQTGYVEAAQSSISDAASSAQKAISEAIYGTPTGAYESMTKGVAGTYDSATSVIGENISVATSYAGAQYSSAQAVVSEALYGPEKNALESAQARLLTAVESARVKLAEFTSSAGEEASEIVSKASEGVEDFASSVSSVISSATSKAKDEL